MTYTAIPGAAAWHSRLILRLALGLAVLVLAVLVGVILGETPLPPSQVATVLAQKLWGAASGVDPIDAGIIWNYRMPRTLVAAACGAGLALSGLVLQTLVRNALADPYLLGVSAGASTGAVAVTIMGVHEMTMNGSVMRMRELPDGLPIPAGETVELKSGGYHLMFMQVPAPFTEGQTVEATLTFEKAGGGPR